MRVYKYALDLMGDQPVAMPRGARVLHVDVQGDQVCLWALVDPTAPVESRHFSVVPTGARLLRSDATYIGTVLLDGGALVLHVFEDPS